jgi:hypothetical protein
VPTDLLRPMHVKPSSFAALVLTVICPGACAQLSGLHDYTSGDPTQPDGSLSTIPLEPRTADAGAAPGELTLGEAGDDGGQRGGPSGDPHPTLADGAPSAVEPSDAERPDDGGKPSDANLVPDGYACGTGTCGGCCSAQGDCVGGQSIATCGADGTKCKDCTSVGACSRGSCATPPPDAGPPPMCVFGSCSNSHCAFFPIQGACCKLDQTCGCQWTAFAPCM